LALALRADAPIYVHREVLKNARLSTADAQNVTAEQMRQWLEGLNDDDMGRYKM